MSCTYVTVDVKKQCWRVRDNPFISHNVRVEIRINGRAHWKWIYDELAWSCRVGIEKFGEPPEKLR